MVVGVKDEKKTTLLKMLVDASTFSLAASLKNHPSGAVVLEEVTSTRFDSVSALPFAMVVTSLIP